jgi:hypothetical protein
MRYQLMVPILTPKMILWHHFNIKMPFLNQRKKRVKLRRMQRACLGCQHASQSHNSDSRGYLFSLVSIEYCMVKGRIPPSLAVNSTSWLKIISKWLNLFISGYLVTNYSKIQKSRDFPIGFY